MIICSTYTFYIKKNLPVKVGPQSCCCPYLCITSMLPSGEKFSFESPNHLKVYSSDLLGHLELESHQCIRLSSFQ